MGRKSRCFNRMTRCALNLLRLWRISAFKVRHDASRRNAASRTVRSRISSAFDVETAQDEDFGPGRGQQASRGRLRVRRSPSGGSWVVGQTVAGPCAAGLLLDLQDSLRPCFSLIAMSAWLNVR